MHLKVSLNKLFEGIAKLIFSKTKSANHNQGKLIKVIISYNLLSRTNFKFQFFS